MKINEDEYGNESMNAVMKMNERADECNQDEPR